MTDRSFIQALNIVLLLDQSGCLKQGGDPDDLKNDQKQGHKPCNNQLRALLIIQAQLRQLYPEKPEEDLIPELYLDDK